MSSFFIDEAKRIMSKYDNMSSHNPYIEHQLYKDSYEYSDKFFNRIFLYKFNNLSALFSKLKITPSHMAYFTSSISQYNVGQMIYIEKYMRRASHLIDSRQKIEDLIETNRLLLQHTNDLQYMIESLKDEIRILSYKE